MCGIVGIAATEPLECREWLELGVNAIAHRGPDGEGVWWSEGDLVGLAHRRLAIVDLTSAGQQPMHYEDTKCTIVFNGEIYNYQTLRQELIEFGYRFTSQTDTEVILAAYDRWGTHCVDQFKGMFAFALFDPDRNHIFLARDRAGEKPLFYKHINGTIKFGSELKALISDKSVEIRVSPKAMDSYLSMGYVSGSDCILEGFNKLPPAHYAIFDLKTGDLFVSPYWNMPPIQSDVFRTANDDGLVETLENLLENAVGMQLVADVPVGVLLSGGVDSSLITAVASRISTKVKTFTVGFTGYDDFDETVHARSIANHFNTEHMEFNAGEVGPEILISLARQYDEPMVDSSMLPTYLVSKLVREHCTVALGGDGADELFGGYRHYSRILKLEKFNSLLPHLVGNSIANIATFCLPQGQRGRNWIRSLAYDLSIDVPLIASLFDKSFRKKLLLGSSLRLNEEFSETIWKNRTPESSYLLDRITRMDFLNYLPEDILVKVDRSSMLNSLEIRTPFLDSEIIEFAFSQVPLRLKADKNNRKILLRKLANKLLPPEFDAKRKQGFSVPLERWLKNGAWREFFHEILCTKDSIFDQKCVADLFKGIDAGRANGERLFSLVMFELWRREYKVLI